MKKFFNLVLSFVIAASFFISCDDDTKDPITPQKFLEKDTVVIHDTVFVDKVIPTYKFTAQLKSDMDIKFENFSVTVEDTTVLTDEKGSFVLYLKEGDYKLSVEKNNFYYRIGEKNYVVSSKESYDFKITKNYDAKQTFDVVFDVKEVNKMPILITEVYCSNVTYHDEESNSNKTLQKDKYIKLYNNSSVRVTVKNFCFSIAFPYMSNTVSQNHFDEYKNEGWTPSADAIWYTEEIEFEPYEEKVFVIFSAEDYTSLGGVNLKNENYYCLIDMSSALKHPNYYTEPSEVNTKFDVVVYGEVNAWAIGNSPALFIYSLGDESPKDFAEKIDNQINLQGKDWGKLGSSLKIRNVDIIDGVDIRNGTNANYKQRLPEIVDKGFVTETTLGKGYSCYRNVDKTATEQLPENKDKIVYGYAFGTENISGSTDPSGIDAQASIKNGAHIIYLDTDNSSNDFHQRSQASLKD